MTTRWKTPKAREVRMKRRFWIGGVLLLMIFTGMTGCGGPKEPPPEHMLDGPDMMYTPED